MPYDDLTNEELTDLYRKTEDKDIVYVLFSRIKHHLVAMAMDMLKEKEDVEDTLSDVVVELFDDLKKRKLNNFGGFSYIKTKNKCLTFLKRKGRTEQLDLANQKYPDDLVENPILDSLDEKPIETVRQVLTNCMERLPEKEKRCLKLFFYYERGNGKFGLSYREIEKHTGYSNREVTSALQRAKRLVRKCAISKGIEGTDILNED